MANYLTAEDYDAAEARALATVPNRIIQCCRPVVFSALGYPMKVPSTRGAALYLDVMQELRTETTFDGHLGGGITLEELKVLRSIVEKVAAMTEELYGRRMAPRSSLLRSLSVVRHIRYAMPDRNAIILEIGSGSGYVGALLLEFGYRYICNDITQGFYLFQNHLFNAVTGGRVLELATEPVELFDLREFPPNCAVHVPWWKFVVVAPEVKFNLDVVTCNHALCEMHPLARGYTITLAHHFLRGPGFRPFLFEGGGYNVDCPMWMVARDFTTCGFVFTHHDTQLTLVERSDSAEASHALQLPRLGAANEEAAFTLPTFVSQASPITNSILAKRENIKHLATVGLAEFNEMLRTVLGREDLSTDDERFLNFIKDPRGW